MTGSVQEGETPGSEREIDVTEERRVAMERKSKGKKVATPQTRKSQRTSSVRESPRTLPKYSGPGNAESESEEESEEEEEEEEEEEVPNFEWEEIWVTKKLLTSMAKFDDPSKLKHTETGVQWASWPNQGSALI